jgi:hypothetical protein
MGPGQDPRQHSWWAHVPEDQRQRLIQRSRWGQLREWSRRKPVRISGLLMVYAVFCLLPWMVGAASLSLMALLPAVLMAALGALAWWLTWKEFHQ